MKKTALSILAVVAPLSMAHATESRFDKPVATVTKSLPSPKDMPKATLTCHRFARFTVKQIDEGEIGAAQLSIIPAEGGKPAVCQKENVPGEKIVSPTDWSGYFKGVKGSYVFFDADDGVNGGLGFAVYAAESGKKLFEESASGNLESLVLDGTELTIRYKRSAEGKCSVVKDGDACWQTIAKTMSLDPAAKPDCASGYVKAKTDLARARCEADSDKRPSCLASEEKIIEGQHWDEAPSVVIYEAETVIDGTTANTKPLTPALACHPSD